MSAGVFPEMACGVTARPEGLTARPVSSVSFIAWQAATVGDEGVAQTRAAWLLAEGAADAVVTAVVTSPRDAEAASATERICLRMRGFSWCGGIGDRCRPCRTLQSTSIAWQWFSRRGS